MGNVTEKYANLTMRVGKEDKERAMAAAKADRRSLTTFTEIAWQEKIERDALLAEKGDMR